MRSTTSYWEKGGKINAHRLPTALAHPKGAENEERGLAVIELVRDEEQTHESD